MGQLITSFTDPCGTKGVDSDQVFKHVSVGCVPPPPELCLNAAIKNNTTNTVLYFRVEANFSAFLVEAGAGGKLEKKPFITMWKNIAAANEVFSQVGNLVSAEPEAVSRNMEANNIFYIAKRSVDGGQTVVYFSMKTVNNLLLLAEITFKQGVNGCKLCVKTDTPLAAGFAQAEITRILQGN